MLSASATVSLPEVEDWLCQPLPLEPHQIRKRELRAKRSLAAHVRYLYFDLGRQMLKNLSPTDADIVRDFQRQAYENYKHRCVVENRRPIRYQQYLHSWRAWQKLVWLVHDVPKRARAVLGIGDGTTKVRQLR